jgi:hypothetical protein
MVGTADYQHMYIHLYLYIIINFFVVVINRVQQP